MITHFFKEKNMTKLVKNLYLIETLFYDIYSLLAIYYVGSNCKFFDKFIDDIFPFFFYSILLLGMISIGLSIWTFCFMLQEKSKYSRKEYILISTLFIFNLIPYYLTISFTHSSLNSYF